MNRRFRNHILNPLLDLNTPEWLPLPRFISRRQERRRRWPPFKDDATLDILKVHKVSLNIRENGPLHHTEKYDSMLDIEKPKLVVRRGQEFAINFFFTRPFNKDNDGISFLFSVADGKPSMSHGTLVVVPLLTKNDSSSNSSAWTAFIDEIDDNRVKVQFKTSSKCSVGKWKVAVDTKLKDDQAAVSHNFKEPIYILFNPWNADDQVYLEGDEEKRYEYILEDTGLIWRGSYNRLRPTPWAYSQFEKDVLDCALYLLSGPGHLSPTARADPVRTVRAISAAVNSPDEDGLVEGNWSENFDGGVPPTKWAGSLKIIQKYFLNKKPVKYGQCWVFAGVVTTICRTLGIPSRPVTNYQSAHDTQSSLTVDYFLDSEGKAVESLNTDSVWNFHVWNETWMARPDIEQIDNDPKNKYGGWQVVDATPQERSDEMYRCGPASVEAVRRGEIQRPFDGPFVFSEVNADKVYWHYRGVSKPLKLLGKKEEAIGMVISTKALGRFERDDITDTYKYPEKSSEEREAMLAALRLSESLFSRYYLNEDFNDVRFDLILRDDIVIGSSFGVILKVKNVNLDVDYDVTVSLRIDTMMYTGKIKEQVKKEKYEIQIERDSEKEIALDVTYDDYSPKLCDQCGFNIACLAKVNQTSFEYFAQDDFRVRKPDIKFLIPGAEDIVVGEPFIGTVTLINPLPVQLKKCQFLIEGPGLGEPIKIKLKEYVEPGETAEADFEFTPRLVGDKTVSAKFTSNELQDVDGFITVVVNPNNDIIPISENEL